MKPTGIEQVTGRLYSSFWHTYDDKQFLESISLFERRWIANSEPGDFFHRKRCLDVGCGGGRYSFAMARMGAAEVAGVDIGEEGLVDARRRAEKLGIRNVTFERASALNLPFAEASFDFVCCAGVLHHSASIEKGLAEIFRVLRPEGSMYLLLYGAGGMFWPLNAMLRPLAMLVGQTELERAALEAGYDAAKRRAVLDDLFVPILETYIPERVDRLLTDAGFYLIRHWNRARLDHESSALTLLSELQVRLRLWESASRTCAGSPAVIALHGAGLCRASIDVVRSLIDLNEAGQLSDADLYRSVVGHGHHRLVALKPASLKQ